MSQIWKNEKVVPVTVIEVRPNTVLDFRTNERDGYDAVRVKLGKTIREGRLRAAQETLKPGDEVTVDALKEGDVVQVSGNSKGRGFQGVVKRHGFHGGPKTHGQKNRLRAPGSIGSTAPQRVWRGRRMAGRMGNVKVTMRNLKVVGVDTASHTIFLKGAVPGPIGGFLTLVAGK